VYHSLSLQLSSLGKSDLRGKDRALHLDRAFQVQRLVHALLNFYRLPLPLLQVLHRGKQPRGHFTDLRPGVQHPLNVDIAPVGLNQLLECYASWQRLCAAQEMAQRRFHLVGAPPGGPGWFFFSFFFSLFP